MSQPPGLKIALKRGALLAAANWPLVAVQFVVESTFQLLLAVPVFGGVVLVVLLLDADAGELLTGDLRLVVGAVIAALWQNPAALAAFLLSFLIVLVGGSVLTFVAKSGTVALMAEAEAAAGAIERPPLKLQLLKRANRTDIEPFLDACRRFWRRYIRLGLCLLLVYLATASVYLPLLYPLLLGRSGVTGNVGILVGWTVLTAAVSSALFVWITLVNVFYLLTQMVMTVEDIGVRQAFRDTLRFVRTSLRELAGIFGVVLVLVLTATVASFLGTIGLGLMSWVPIVAFAVMPLQIAAWLLRGFVFQYLALTALGAYLTQYRYYRRGPELAAVPGQRLA